MAARTNQQIHTMKYKSQLISGACIAALAFCAPLTASAQFKKSSPSPTASPTTSPADSPAKSERALPFRGTISAVDQSAKTFTIAGKETSRVFKVTDRSVITKDGNPATMSDIAEKDEVRGSYWKGADGSLEAKAVKLGAKTEKKESKKKESPSPSPSPTS